MPLTSSLLSCRNRWTAALAVSLVCLTASCGKEAPPRTPTFTKRATEPSSKAAVDDVVGRYCQAHQANGEAKDGAVAMYQEVISKFTRAGDIRAAFDAGASTPGCAPMFWAYFDLAEAFIQPGTLAQVHRYSADEKDVSCMLSRDALRLKGAGETVDLRTCNDTLAGYEIAGIAMAGGTRCDVAIGEAVREGATAPVTAGMRKYYKDVGGDDCAPRPSIDCTGVSICGGGANRELYGLQGILTANFGTSLGSGFGYGPDGSATFSASTYFAARGFWSSGLMDIRTGLGLGMFTNTQPAATPATSGGAATPAMSEARAGALLTAGFGFFHGLIALNLLYTHSLREPSFGDKEGLGLALLVDAATVAKLLDRQ